MKKKISYFLIMCLSLSIMVFSLSAFALQADDAAPVASEETQETAAVQPRGVVYYMKYFELLHTSPGSSKTSGYVDADNIVDNYGSDPFGYDSNYTLWRHIIVVNGFCLGYDGWVPNSSVTSYNT